MEENIVYALIVHWEKSGARIIADYAIENSFIYRDVVLEVMISTITTEEERISVQRGNYTVHLLMSELRYAAVTLTPDGPFLSSKLASSSQTFLNRLRCVYKELPILADLSCDFSNLPVIDISLPLKTILEEFNCQEVEVIPKMKVNLTEIRGVLMENVEKLIDRGQKLDDLVRKTQALEITTRRDFRRLDKSSQRKRNVIVFIAMILITVIAAIISTIAISFFYM